MPGPRNAPEPAIVARDITRRFGAAVAVDRLSLEIPRAQIYGFLGPNGSGKSTTIRMLCGLLRPNSGTIRVLGHEVPRAAEALRSKIGYMTQKFSLWDDLTVQENLQFIARVFTLGKAQSRRRMDAVLEEYRLRELAGRLAGAMSGGQRQRLALAAATLHEPEMLLLDEPTSAVDPQSRRDFWESLFALAARGTTILVSTHYMDEAERCHRLAILSEGRLVAEGEPAHLMENLPLNVIEVVTPEIESARAALHRLPYVRSLAQIGMKLHVLVDRNIADPGASVQASLSEAGLEAQVRATDANLEDVFVAATMRDAPARAAGAA